jgi:hypothetical protein
MRNLLSTLFVFAFVAGIAQQKNVMNAPRVASGNGTLSGVQTKMPDHLKKNRRDAVWMNYAEELDQLSGGASAGAFMLLFPDTLPIVGEYTDGTTARPQWMHGATMLDPKNMLFNPITPGDAYTLDSLAIAYAYLRNTDASVVDTAVVSIIRENNSLIWTLSSGNQTYQDFIYTSSSNSPTSSEVLQQYTIPLDEGDSTNTVNFLEFATTGLNQFSAGSRVGVSVEFRPGFSYSLNDSMNLYNLFYLYSYEENGAGTAPNYFGPVDGNDIGGNMNCSYSLNYTVRYDLNANGWNGYYLPTWAWQDGYAYENHYIYWLINAPNFSVSENELAARVYPNPATDRVQFDFDGVSGSVDVQVVNMAGQTVRNESISAMGTSSMDVSALEAGIYFFHMTAENGLRSVEKIAIR